jgi:hypothetical protein
MKTRPEDLEVINARIFPAILGRRLFLDRPLNTIEMGYGETAMFQALCASLRPRLAIEIGTETGGTLAIIARHSTRVISIDIDPGVKQRLAPRFSNVDFLTGSSHDILPPLLGKLAADRVTPDFIFVDGDHSADGVRRDLEFILSFRPLKQMIVLMHDSFNPGCREGIRAARWSCNPFCHFVDVDFVPGILHPNENCHRQMWGGLALALFLPEPRRHHLEVKATHQLMFEAALRCSVYAPVSVGC